MALGTNALTSYTAVGNREDLSDIIYNVDPIDCPFITGIDSTDAIAVKHEWQSDTLASAAANAVLEGDDVTNDAATVTVRLSNTAQIMDKVPRVTGTQRAVVSAGRRDELSYQVYKRTLELRRDAEFSLVGANTAEVTGDATTARYFGSVESWITSNDSRGSGGSEGGLGNTAATDGTQRAFTEALLKTVLQSCWDNGGDPECVMVGSFNKQKMSTFTGNATRFKTAEDSKLVAGIDIYQSDFGDLQIIPNRFQRPRTAFVLQKDMWAAAYLRPFGMSDISKTGDSDRKQLLVEFTLESRNEKASGVVADLLTS